MLTAMSRWALIVLLAACSSGKADNNAKPTATPPSGPDKIVVPGDPAQAKGPAAPPPTDNPQFHIQPEEGTLTIGKCAGKAGAEMVVPVKVEPAAGYHVSQDFPSSLKLEPPSDVKLAKAELTAGGHDSAQGDATSHTEKLLQFDVKATPAKAGSWEVKGWFKFGVCDKESCHPKKQPITIACVAT
jgi:hypothetical protein